MDKSYLYLKKLLEPNDTVVVGVSTGPDSMCLLNILLNICREKKLKIVVAHVNHHLRKQSETEEKYIKEYCKKENVICEVAHFIPGKSNIEAAAHKFRYDFFEKLIKKYNAKYLMTAHHGDDLIETIIMREIRGSNLKGYAGFGLEERYENYSLIRPLLFYTKDDILRYVDDNSIKYFIDETNFSQEHLRNRIRMNILPNLKKENPNIHLKYLQYSSLVFSSYKVLQKIANEKYKEVYNNNRLMISAFLKQEQVIQEQIIEKILKELYQDDMDMITNKQTKGIIGIITRNNPNETLNLPNNFKVIRKYDELFFEKNDVETMKIDTRKHQLKNINQYNNQVIKVVGSSSDTSNYVTRLDSNEISLPLYVRTRLNGDKMTIKNMQGTKKIKDIFIDSKVPIAKRNSWLLVCDSKDNIIWLPGLKKSKFDKEINEKYDIILMFTKEGENYE